MITSAYIIFLEDIVKSGIIRSQVYPLIKSIIETGKVNRTIVYSINDPSFDYDLADLKNLILEYRDYQIEFQILTLHGEAEMLQLLGTDMLSRNVSLVHARSYYASFFAYKIKQEFGIPFLFDTRGLMPEEGKLIRAERPGNISAQDQMEQYTRDKKLEQILIYESDATVVVNEPCRKHYQSAYAQTKAIDIIELFMAETNRKFNLQKRRQVRRTNNWEDKIVMVFSGNFFSPWYDSDLLFRWYETLQQDHNDLVLMLLLYEDTQHPYIDNLKQRIASFGWSPEQVIVFDDPKKDMAGLLSAADIATIPHKEYYREMLKVVQTTKLTEYLGFGLPVICCDYSEEINQLLSENETAGWLLPGGTLDKKNLNAISIIIDEMRHNRQTDRRKKIQELALSRNYTLKSATDKYIQIYDRIIQNSTEVTTTAEPQINAGRENGSDTDQQKKHLPKVSFLALEKHSFACPQIRLVHPLKALDAQGRLQYLDMDLVTNRIENIDLKSLRELSILIVQRNFAKEVPYQKLIGALGINRPKIVFEFDDAFDRLEKDHPGYEYYESMKDNFRDYIRNADLVTVSTPVLKSYYNHLSEKIIVLPNALSENIWAVTTAKKPQKDEVVRILFSGTIGHEPDLAIIKNTLEQILKEYGERVELLLWGNISPRLEKLSNVKVFNTFKTSYAEYAELLKNANVDIALVPLINNDFNQAKSHIKWLEYSACKIAGIYSAIPAYSEAIENQKTGILVENKQEDWDKGIRQLIDQPAFRTKIAEAAYKEVWEKHSLSVQIHQWEQAYQNVLNMSSRAVKTSIIVPVFNKVEYTQKCLEAVYKHTAEEDFELIFVDNASSDATASYLSHQADLHNNMQIISNSVNLGFAGANNQAAELARGEYLLFLNNDTEVRPGWLEALLSVAENDESVGAVSGKLLYPDGSIQHAGVVIANDQKNKDPLLATHNFHHAAGDAPGTNQPMVYQALSAACLLVRKEIFRQVEGFDTEFWNGYEDVDLCFKIGELGLKLVYQPTCIVTHHESKSGPERWAKVGDNINLLHKRWLSEKNPDCIIYSDGRQEWTAQSQVKPYHAPTNKELPEKDIKLTSIIILTYNAIEYTQKCVNSILANTMYPYEIIFVDNNSTDGTKKYLRQIAKEHQHITTILNKKNKGFAAGNNQGVKRAKGDYVMLLNNDVLVAEGWLEGMVKALEKDQKIGMVGPLTNRISGLQMVDKIPYNDDAGFFTYASNFRKQFSGNVTPRRRIAGFAVLMKKSLYETVKGFDTDYGTGNYEDDDLCLKVREKGYAIMVDEGTFIHHYGSQTFKANKINVLKSLEEKGKVFREKWPDVDYEDLLEMKNPLSKLHVKQMERTVELISQNKYDDALNIYRSILIDHPIHEEALLGAAMCSNFLQQFDEALEFLNKLVRLDPENAHALNQSGLALMGKGDPDSAQSAFALAVEKDPQLIDAQRNYADALIESADFENGIQTLLTILKNHPHDIPTLLYLAELNLETERFDEALEYTEIALNLDPANTLANQLKKLIATQTEAPSTQVKQANDRLSKAEKQIAAGTFDKALHTLNNLLQMEPDNGLAYNLSGQALVGLKKYEQAKSAFLMAIEKDPGLIDAQRNYGDMLIETGDYENGIRVFNKILENHPDDIASLLYLANLNYETDRFEDCRDLVERALSIQPDHPVAREFKVLLDNLNGTNNDDDFDHIIAKANERLAEGDSAAAIPIYNQILDSDPENVAALYGLAVAFQMDEKFDQSRTFLLKLIKVQSEFKEAHTMLGNIALINNQPAQAIKHFEASLEIDNAQPNVSNALANALIDTEQFEAGIQILIETLNDYPEHIATLKNLGLLNLEAGKQEEAMTYFRKILEYDPNETEVAGLIQSIQA